jgi:hypothetical protein
MSVMSELDVMQAGPMYMNEVAYSLTLEWRVQSYLYPTVLILLGACETCE